MIGQVNRRIKPGLLVAVLLATTSFSSQASAASLYYTFHGSNVYNSGLGVYIDEVDFVLEVDFDRLGTYRLDDGTIVPVPDTFYVDYYQGYFDDVSGTSGVVERNYGGVDQVVEGPEGNMLFLRNLTVRTDALNGNGNLDLPENWHVGKAVDLWGSHSSPFSSFSSDPPGITITSISNVAPVPLPGALVLLMSGLSALVGFSKFRKTGLPSDSVNVSLIGRV